MLSFSHGLFCNEPNLAIFGNLAKFQNSITDITTWTIFVPLFCSFAHSNRLLKIIRDTTFVAMKLICVFTQIGPFSLAILWSVDAISSIRMYREDSNCLVDMSSVTRIFRKCRVAGVILWSTISELSRVNWISQQFPILVT